MKRVESNNNYSISKDGKVYSHISNKFLKPTLNTHGYHIVNLQGKVKAVHRLVAENFIPKDDTKNLEVNHIDGNKNNNGIDNLEWVSHSKNINHAFDNNLMVNEKGKNAPRLMYKVFKINKDGIVVDTYYGMHEASRAMNVTVQSIFAAIKENRISCGYFWKKELIA